MIRHYLSLIKIRLSMAVAVAALAGFWLRAPLVDGRVAALFAAVLLLACGCAALNNHQDRILDRRFERTRNRPLPAGNIPPATALVMAAILIFSGLAGLLRLSLPVFLLGCCALCCYNLLYTPLKQKTAWAMLPGIACGMLPPWMGWLAAGGAPFDFNIWVVMIVFGLWQMPHFWLLVLANESDYRSAGFPTLLARLGKAPLNRILLVWVVSVAVSTLCLPLAEPLRTSGSLVVLVLNAGAVTAVACYLLLAGRTHGTGGYRLLFIHLNLAVFISLAAVVIDRALIFAGS